MDKNPYQAPVSATDAISTPDSPPLGIGRIVLACTAVAVVFLFAWAGISSFLVVGERMPLIIGAWYAANVLSWIFTAWAVLRHRMRLVVWALAADFFALMSPGVFFLVDVLSRHFLAR